MKQVFLGFPQMSEIVKKMNNNGQAKKISCFVLIKLWLYKELKKK